MQSTLNLDAVQVRPVGISLEEGVATLKCEIKKVLKTKSYLCEETVTYGDVLKTMVGFVALLALIAVSGYLFGGEVM